ncbi:MAG: sensor histidine kinase [Candidatus Limnocylindrales bacterium]
MHGLAGRTSLRSRLTVVLAALTLSLGALALIGLVCWLGGAGSDPSGGTGSTILLATGSGLVGAIQVVTAGSASDSVLGVAPGDLPLVAAAAWLALVPVSLLVGWRIAGRMVRPITQVTEAARTAGPVTRSEQLPTRARADELERLHDAFHDLIDRFERHELDRRRLVDDASHEVRNPLAVMRTSLEVALAEPVDPDALRAAAEVSQRASERISRTVDELSAALRDRARPTARTPVDLADVARELGRDYDAVASRRGVAIVVTAPSGVIVPADREALKRGVANLVANAIRFAPPGSPVHIAAGSTTGWRWLGVRDFGPGIAEADQALVFRRAWRASGQDPDGGAGIGLALVRQIAEAHGGAVRLTSAPRAGSSFVIWLPVREDDGAQAIAVDARADPLWALPTPLEA